MILHCVWRWVVSGRKSIIPGVKAIIGASNMWAMDYAYMML